eukprot:1142191-Pelagomonas_calceolata.AAC.7
MHANSWRLLHACKLVGLTARQVPHERAHKLHGITHRSWHLPTAASSRARGTSPAFAWVSSLPSYKQ